MTNPKLIFEGDELFVIDAPENRYPVYPSANADMISGGRAWLRYNNEVKAYQETLSKAPRWDVKNKEEVLKLIDYANNFARQSNWQPEKGKLYDLPEGYSVKLIEGTKKFNKSTCYVLKEGGKENDCGWPDCFAYHESCRKIESLALLIPQAEEVREDKKELQEIIAKVHDDIEGRYELDSYDKGIIHSLLCKLQ